MRQACPGEDRDAAPLCHGEQILNYPRDESGMVNTSVMFQYYEMSYGLNVEMHKQMEIAKRLNAIIAQLLPFLSQEVNFKIVLPVLRRRTHINK
jgi:hypothetical protein